MRQRHIAGDLGSGDLALRAASAALASAGLERVDAVVLATSTGDFCCPATAPRVAARLGLVGALAFDLSAACTGFVYGLTSVGSLISAGLADSALLVGVDTFSHTLDPPIARPAHCSATAPERWCCVPAMPRKKARCWPSTSAATATSSTC